MKQTIKKIRKKNRSTLKKYGGILKKILKQLE